MPYKSYNCITISQEEIENYVSNLTTEFNYSTDEYVTTYSIKEAVFEYNKHMPIVTVYFDLFENLNAQLNRTDWEVRNGIYKDGSGGSIVGGIIDNLLPKFMTKHSIYKFKHGEDNKEVDCICIELPFLNSEVKTTGAETVNKKQTINGSKTQAADISKGSTKYVNDDWHFYTFCAYHIPRTPNDNLIINDIYVGVLKRSQWKSSITSKGSGSASIPVKVFEKQFFNVYHRNIEVSYST